MAPCALQPPYVSLSRPPTELGIVGCSLSLLGLARFGGFALLGARAARPPRSGVCCPPACGGGAPLASRTNSGSGQSCPGAIAGPPSVLHLLDHGAQCLACCERSRAAG